MAWTPPRDERSRKGLGVLEHILQQWASLHQQHGDVFDDLCVRRACGDCYGGCEQESQRRPNPGQCCNSLDVAVGSRPSQGVMQVSKGGSVARMAVSAASSASFFSMSSSCRRRSASSDWAISIRNMGNGPRQMAPPRPVSGAGGRVSWDGVKRSHMVGCGKKTAGGLWPQGVWQCS